MNRETDPSSPISPSSLKQKLKSSFRLSWRRHSSSHNENNQNIPSSLSSTTPLPSPHPSPRDNKARLSMMSSNNWLKSPEIKEKCRNLFNRIGHGHGPSHRHSRSQSNSHINGYNHGRRHSADFRYDPSSYALNFDKGIEDSQLDEFPYRNFTSRLPPSPSTSPSLTPSTSTSTSRETKVTMPLATLHPCPKENKARLSRISSNNWLKSPEIKEQHRNLINSIGHGHGHGHGLTPSTSTDRETKLLMKQKSLGL